MTTRVERRTAFTYDLTIDGRLVGVFTSEEDAHAAAAARSMKEKPMRNPDEMYEAERERRAGIYFATVTYTQPTLWDHA